MPVGIQSLPTFGRNLQTALTKLICLADFIVSQVWLKLLLRPSLSHGAYLKGLPIFGRNLQTALAELMCLADFTVSHVWLKLFLAALTEFFCQSEFIVSIRLVETYRRPSLS